jgi:Protein of unknown function (DUF2808)
MVNVMIKAAINFVKRMMIATAITAGISTTTFATSSPQLGDLSTTKYRVGAILSNYHFHVVTSTDERGLNRLEVLFPEGMQTPKVNDVWLAFGEGEKGDRVRPQNVEIEGQKVTISLEKPIIGATEMKVYFDHLTNPSRASYSPFRAFEVSVMHSDPIETFSHPVFLGYRYIFLK